MTYYQPYHTNDAKNAYIKKIIRITNCTHQYQNLQRELCNCNANIYFNKKKCARNNISPKSAKIKIPNTSPASKFTQQKANILRSIGEMKFRCIKKQNLNQRRLYLPFLLANSWNKLGPYIENTIEEKLNVTFNIKHQKLNSKLDKLMQEKIRPQTRVNLSTLASLIKLA